VGFEPATEGAEVTRSGRPEKLGHRQ